MEILKEKLFFKKLGLLFVVLFSLLYSVNAVVLTPGVDADITYGDSSKGIWWSTLTIYARTGISVGDIIEMPYVASNSTDYGLFPLMLKVKDQDMIICVNEELDNVAPYTSYPLCFYNNDKWYAEAGFNYSVRESQSLFTTKDYDIVWGKFHQPSNTINIGYSFSEYENDYNSSFFTPISSTSSDYLSSINFNNIMRKTFTHSNSNNKIDYNYYHDNVPTFIDRVNFTTVITHYSCDSGDSAGRTVTLYLGSTSKSQSSSGDYYANGNSGQTRTDMFYNASITLQPPRVYSNDISNSYYCTVSGTNPITVTYDSFQNNVTLKSNKEFSYCNDLTLGNKVLSKNCNENITFKYNQTKEHEVIQLPFTKHSISKETDDAINGVNLVPYQTNSNWKAYTTLKEVDTTTLWFDLYDFNTPILTNDLDSYIVDGENTILVDQVNEDGGFWLFFEGQYNEKPIVQGTVISNTTTFKKSTKATCSGGTYYDADSDPVNSQEYAWFRNDVYNTNGSTIDLSLSTFVKSDTIKCGKRYNDGKEWGDWVYSTQYVVQDTEPTITIEVSPSDPQPSDDLTCTFSNYSDIDSDTLISQNMYWIENGTVLNSSSGTSVFLSNSVMENNKIYECRVQLNQAGYSHNESKLATLINLAPELTGITTPSNTYSNYVSIANFCTATDINEDQLYWTFQYTTDLVNWNNIVVNQSTNTLNWNVSLLADNAYYLRCKANDDYLETNYSNAVSLNVINFDTSHVKSNKAFYATTLTLESSSPSNMNQYTSGTTGLYCGDFNGATAECYFYTPVKFDASKNLYYLEITPYQYYESGTVYQTGFTQNVYDAMVYEVSNIGDIPGTSPILRKTGITFEMDTANRINLNIVPDTNMYVAVKVCTKSDLSGACGIVDNGGDDLIFLYGKTSGSYIMKTRQGSTTAITNYDSNIEFNWQDSISNNLKVEVNELYGDSMLEPMLIKDSEGSDICVNSKISSFYQGVPSSCITSKGSNLFDIELDDVSKSGLNEFEILWGKELDITGTTYNDALIKSSTPVNDVKMQIYGLANAGSSYTSNVKLRVNTVDLWSYPSTLNGRETTNSVKSNFNQLLNNMIWTTNTPGKIIYHFEPYYINFSVEAPDNLVPVNNGIATLRLNVTTNLEINPTLSYCKIEGNNVNVQSSTFVQTAVGIYKCEPSLEFSHLAGSYKWTVHVQDTNGQYRVTDGFFTYGSLESLTVTNLNFGEAELLNNTEDLKNTLLVENTGNTLFNYFTVDVIEDKFWDEDGVKYFSYKDKMGYAPTKDQLDSVKYYNKLDFDDPNEIYNGSLSPGQNVETWWKLQVDRTIKEGDYTSKWNFDKGVNE